MYAHTTNNNDNTNTNNNTNTTTTNNNTNHNNNKTYIYIHMFRSRTNGVNTYGAAAKVTKFVRLGTKSTPGHRFWEMKVG